MTYSLQVRAAQRRQGSEGWRRALHLKGFALHCTALPPIGDPHHASMYHLSFAPGCNLCLVMNGAVPQAVHAGLPAPG